MAISAAPGNRRDDMAIEPPSGSGADPNIIARRRHPAHGLAIERRPPPLLGPLRRRSFGARLFHHPADAFRAWARAPDALQLGHSLRRLVAGDLAGGDAV